MSFRNLLLGGSLILLAACQAETFTSPGPTGLEVLHGPPALVSLGTELDTLLTVRVVDAEGRPQVGVPVRWRVVAGDGEVIPADSLSGVDGIALARWKFRYIPGVQQVQVQAAAQDPVTFRTEARGFRAVQVTAGYTHACALDADGAPWCWNADSIERGAPGRYNDIRPTLVSGGLHFAELHAGDDFTCGRTAAGAVWCWGYAYGEAFGPGITLPQGTPFQLSGLPPLRLLRTGARHGCGIAATDSTTWCWGENRGQQAGAGPVSLPPTQVVTPLRFVDLALGTQHSCGLTATQEVYCWGLGSELGDSGVTRSAPTTPVAGGHSFLEIQSGDANTCGRTTSGEVWCWGWSVEVGERPTPVREALGSVTSLAVAADYIAGTTLGGGVRFATFFGHEYTLPTEMHSLGWSQISGRGSYCMISRSGDVYCSGSIVDQISCSSISPYGCAPAGPIPLPAGGRVYGYPPFGD